MDARPLDANASGPDCELIGRGYTADVYAWGEGLALKLFHRGGPAERAEREYHATRAAHGSGLPAPAVVDLIEIDGRFGIVFERLNGRSMFDEVRERPWTLFAAARQLAELHLMIHERPCPGELPTVKTRLRGWIDAADRSPAEKDGARAALDALPDGGAVCHGDFHPANVLHTKRGWVAIDWGSAFRGPPVADVACTSRLFDDAGLPPWAPRYMHWLLACSRSLLHRTYLSRYFAGRSYSRADLSGWKGLFNAWKPPLTDEAAGVAAAGLSA